MQESISFPYDANKHDDSFIEYCINNGLGDSYVLLFYFQQSKIYWYIYIYTQ